MEENNNKDEAMDMLDGFFDSDDDISDFLEPSPEELAIRKEKAAKELLEKGFLPENDGYSETMSSPMEAVEQNPRQFIIEECVPACQILWSKNIYTFMVSDHLNEGVCWIEIIADSLSDENKNIFLNLAGDDIIKFAYHSGCLNFGVKCVGKKAQERLAEIASGFAMQDVPYKQGYIMQQEFLINHCGCYDEVPNPDYIPMAAPWDAEIHVEQIADYMEKYEEWEASNKSKESIRIYNPNNATKSLPDYLGEHNMVGDGDRVYLTPYHYQKHLNYINYLNNLDNDNKPKLS